MFPEAAALGIPIWSPALASGGLLSSESTFFHAWTGQRFLSAGWAPEWGAWGPEPSVQSTGWQGLLGDPPLASLRFFGQVRFLFARHGSLHGNMGTNAGIDFSELPLLSSPSNDQECEHMRAPILPTIFPPFFHHSSLLFPSAKDVQRLFEVMPAVASCLRLAAPGRFGMSMCKSRTLHTRVQKRRIFSSQPGIAGRRAVKARASP